MICSLSHAANAVILLGMQKGVPNLPVGNAFVLSITGFSIAQTWFLSTIFCIDAKFQRINPVSLRLKDIFCDMSHFDRGCNGTPPAPLSCPTRKPIDSYLNFMWEKAEIMVDIT